MRARAGTARASLQVHVAYLHDGDDRQGVTDLARRRFGPDPIVGTGPELVENFSALAERGVERFYAWFCDFARPADTSNHSSAVS